MLSGSFVKKKDLLSQFNASIIDGNLEQVKSCVPQMILDPTDAENPAIFGMEWSLTPFSTPKNLMVVNYLLNLPQTRKWFNEYECSKLVTHYKNEFEPIEKEKREKTFYRICTRVWMKLNEFGLTNTSFASEIINHLLQIAQDCCFKLPAEFIPYKRMSLSSIWSAFTTGISSFFWGTSQSVDSITLNDSRSDSAYESDNDRDYVLESENDDEDYQRDVGSQDENDVDYRPDLDSEDENDSDYQPSSESDDDYTNESDYESDINDDLESDSDDNSFDLIAYQKWKKAEEKKAEDKKKSAKRVQPEKSIKSSDVDSDEKVTLKRQRKN